MPDNPQLPSESRRRGLGKGLGALIPGAEAAGGERPAEIPLRQLNANPLQPRQAVDPQEMAGLVDSIRRHGVLQPIVVRPSSGGFEVVAGERRWRAAEAAGLSTIPAVVRSLTDQEALELALVENLQREDLNPMERARAYRRLISDFGLKQEDVAERVGKSQPSVANSLRLLNLPPQIQASLESGRITEGHARALLSAGTEAAMLRLWERVERRGLSVRETEQLARAAISREIRPRSRARDPQLMTVEQDLSRRYATKVSVDGTRTRGRLAFEYYSEEDLQRLLDLLLG
ncbi:MAG: ParB/RepB/Spo0J family partition protein [Armatimonadota bacterium]|nr:ParB/RepB/Spo0J family partition protein [Armatimonadota bacterium]MDR7451089.1 ParB/RepB/Spo0J family partition protein [Armatimonadota bacterium]MDR7465890.1 ParB/RepB/Spo0J family partition protein [Armatimonadota bacterium]MDR7493955.1 ParB/RepB/Spo0J family partition protein [Armatimonadota bacterium]MDR7498405.1 ParB/RepB/Spo0J family partition protein [Armatimonadota bacterium]